MSIKTRTETDLLGQLEIDNSNYYGIHTQRGINNFKISGSKIADYPIFIEGMVTTKKATALANKELGTIPEDKCNMIIQACDEILKNLNKYAKEFPLDLFQGGAGTSVNMNTNEVIANVALEMNGYERGDYKVLHPNDHVNKCQSTNDAYPTGFRVALYYSIDKLLLHIEKLANAFNEKAGEFSKVIKMGRTQLQDAVPMSLGEEFGAWAINLLEEIVTLSNARNLILEVNLGATAIGTGVNAPKEYSHLAIKNLANLTNAKFVEATNLVEATSDTGAYVMISGALKRTALKLSKICNDLRLLSSGPRCGLNEINLPIMQAGSSIMPAKVNPVIPEVCNQVCFKIIGNDVTISFAAEGGQLQLNVMEPVIGQCLFESIKLLTNACDSLRMNCVNGITANEKICRDMVHNSIGIITYLNPFIGHNKGDMIGKKAALTGRNIKELILEEGLLTEKELDNILSDENLMHPEYKAKTFK